MPVESDGEFAVASCSPLSSYSGGDLAPSGSERRNAGERKDKEQEAHTDDTKDPDVAITTHIGDVEVNAANSAEDIPRTVQDLGDDTVDQQQVTDEDVTYVHKGVAENMLRDEKKQSFILESQKEDLKISPEGKYEEGIHWNRKKRLGIGACGECFIAFDQTTGHQFVAKLVRTRDEERDWKSTCKEMRIVCRLNNQHIVRMYGCMSSKEQCPIFMEYIHGETLAECFKKCKNIKLEVVLNILSQLLECLAHMEKENVTHGDITLDNIMVSTDWHICLIDFANGCVLDDRHSSDKHDEDLYTVFQRFIYMIALCSPWRKYYTGFELFHHVENGEFYMFDGTPQLREFIKDGLCLCDSAAELLDRVGTEFIKDIVAVDPAVFGEHVVPPCGGTPMHNNKDDEFIGRPIQESFKAHVEEE